MPRDQDGNAALVLMAFVMGAVTGAAVALLYAPITGEETRRLLNERAREGRDRAVDAAQRGREFVREQREHLTTAIDRGRETYGRATGGATAEAAEEQG
jgi:gas vesicle protein